MNDSKYLPFADITRHRASIVGLLIQVQNRVSVMSQSELRQFTEEFALVVARDPVLFGVLQSVVENKKPSQLPAKVNK